MPPTASVCSLDSAAKSLVPALKGLLCDQEHVGQRAPRNAPLIEPIVADFLMPGKLPKLLVGLGVCIDTYAPEVTLQYSVHACPRRMRREMGLVFPDVVGREAELLVIPTFQRTESSMISYDSGTQSEKDAKLHLFYRWGAELVSRLRMEGYWADVTDPMSGMALFTKCGPSLYPDVEGAEVLLRYAPFSLGSCFVLSHPRWGTHIYPATAFALAPIEAVRRVLNDMQKECPY